MPQIDSSVYKPSKASIFCLCLACFFAIIFILGAINIHLKVPGLSSDLNHYTSILNYNTNFFPTADLADRIFSSAKLVVLSFFSFIFGICLAAYIDIHFFGGRPEAWFRVDKQNHIGIPRASH